MSNISNNIYSNEIKQVITKTKLDLRFKINKDLDHSLNNIDFSILEKELKQLVLPEIDGGTAVSLGEEFTVNEVKDVIESYFEEYAINNPINIERFCNNLISGLRNLHISPALKQILLNVIAGIITAIIVAFYINPLINAEIQPNQSPRATVKEIKRTVSNTGVNLYVLKEYRFVRVACLNVRLSNSIKSKLVGKLYMGQMVKVIRKKKNWCLMEYENGDVLIRGWVFTRYLEKFK